jgi:hypothetical protein
MSDAKIETMVMITGREYEALRAENEKLRAAITQAIRQHEEGNRGLSHRTLCRAVYGEQA